MLQTLDVLIGFIMVMLVMSMAVTMVTQFLGTWLLNLKGIALRDGVARLLAILDRGSLSVDEARKIATYLLCDLLIRQPAKFGKSRALATVVHREELVKLILIFARDGDAAMAETPLVNPTREQEKLQLQHKMRKLLAKNGIANPNAVLEAVRAATLTLEKASPQLSSSMRVAAAILKHAKSDFLAKLNSWFDQTIDRVSEVFTTRIRIVTFAVSLAVALLFQLNALELLNRLSVDDQLRDKMVQIAIDRAQNCRESQKCGTDQARLPVQHDLAPPDETNPANSEEDAPAADEPSPAMPTVVRAAGNNCVAQQGASSPADLRKSLKDCVDAVEQTGLIAFPNSWDEWSGGWHANWKDDFGFTFFLQLMGILLSAALLSLGAPFWYAQLSALVRLRSVVAGRDDKERAERQTTQPVSAAT